MTNAVREEKPNYICFSYASGKTEKETTILKMMELCGVTFNNIHLVESHDYDDREWYSNTFHSTKELEAEMGESLRLYSVNANGLYGTAEVEVHFKDWNIFGGVHIGCNPDDEVSILRFLDDFEKSFCE